MEQTKPLLGTQKLGGVWRAVVVGSALAFCTLAFLASAEGADEPPKIEGVIIVIADGVSYEMLTAARIFGGGVKKRLEVEKMPHSAVVRTSSASSVVTDSAAAATAIARGFKTDNLRLGTRPDGSTGPSVFDFARKAGWKTGVVTDDGALGATPAAFVVERGSRGDGANISAKIIDQMGPDGRVDIYLAGGLEWFKPFGDGDENPVIAALAKQNSDRLASRADISFYGDWKSLNAAANAGELVTKTVMGIVRPDTFPFYNEYPDSQRSPRLLEMAHVALDYLKAGGKPYMLFIEAALPDKAAHANKARLAMEEVLEFDACLKMLRQNIGPDVLLVATTDHGTGGMTLHGNLPPTARGETILKRGELSAIQPICWTSGPGAVPVVNDYEMTRVDDTGTHATTETRLETERTYLHPAAQISGSAVHTAGDVWLAAQGPGSNKFDGWIDHTDIFRLIREAMIEGGALKDETTN